jgi:5-methylcytosine-specific restriction endonuclease McrA
VGTGGKRAELLGKSVRVTGTRLGAFKKSLVCAGCGRVGSRFYIERHHRRGGDEKYGDGWHLNLYTVNPNGSETLMTRDHIIPRSKGGRDRLSNSQTMCHKCNNRKGDKMPEEIKQ